MVHSIELSTTDSELAGFRGDDAHPPHLSLSSSPTLLFFAGGFIHDGFAYLVPNMHATGNTNGKGRRLPPPPAAPLTHPAHPHHPRDHAPKTLPVARVDLSDFATVAVCNLKNWNGNAKGFFGGFAHGK